MEGRPRHTSRVLCSHASAPAGVRLPPLQPVPELHSVSIWDTAWNDLQQFSRHARIGPACDRRRWQRTRAVTPSKNTVAAWDWAHEDAALAVTRLSATAYLSSNVIAVAPLEGPVTAVVGVQLPARRRIPTSPHLPVSSIAVQLEAALWQLNEALVLHEHLKLEMQRRKQELEQVRQLRAQEEAAVVMLMRQQLGQMKQLQVLKELTQQQEFEEHEAERLRDKWLHQAKHLEKQKEQMLREIAALREQEQQEVAELMAQRRRSEWRE